MLFIGDSLTYVNDLDQQVLALARLAGLGAGLTIDRVVKGACSVLCARCSVLGALCAVCCVLCVIHGLVTVRCVRERARARTRRWQWFATFWEEDMKVIYLHMKLLFAYTPMALVCTARVLHVCMYVCMRVCIYVHTYVWVGVVYVCMYVYT